MKLMRMAWYFFCGITAVLLFSMQAFCGVLLLTPRDVGGTLFGGMFLDLMCMSGWLLATAGMAVSIVLRFAGARIASLSASALQVGVGIWSLINYPDDANGNLIFSPAPGEIHGMIAIVGSLLFISIYLIGQGYLEPRSVEQFPTNSTPPQENTEKDSL